MDIELRGVTCGYSRKKVLDSVSLVFRTREISCILGPNGVGKTTLFRTLLGFIDPIAGTILLDGQDIRALSARSIARIVAYVPQAKNSAFQHTVLDVVLMGRSLYIPCFGKPSPHDIGVADAVLDQLGISQFRNRQYDKLSGGEQQIVLIARALVQESKFIVMDEPASNLDFSNTKHVLDTLARLTAQNDLGVIMATHSPDHVFYCGSRVMMISSDKEIISGGVDDVLTEENLSAIYGVPVNVLTKKEPDGRLLRSCCMGRE